MHGLFLLHRNTRRQAKNKYFENLRAAAEYGNGYSRRIDVGTPSVVGVVNCNGRANIICSDLIQNKILYRIMQVKEKKIGLLILSSPKFSQRFSSFLFLSRAGQIFRQARSWFYGEGGADTGGYLSIISHKRIGGS